MSMPMKRLLIAVALFLVPALAQAQCNGNFSAGNYCGSVAGGAPGPVPAASVVGTLPLPNSDIYVGNASNKATAVAPTGTGDCTFTFSNLGVFGYTCLKTNGVMFGPLATASSVTNTELAQMPAGTVKANLTGSTANPIDATIAQLKSAASIIRSVTDPACGAKGDGATDDRVAIQTCINAVQGNGVLYLPFVNNGVYLLNSTFNASAVLSITAPLKIVCDPGVWLKPGVSVPNTASILYFTGQSGAVELDQSKTIVVGCGIGDPAATVRTGNHGIVFDTTNATTSLFVQPLVEDVKVTFSNISAHACWSSIAGCAILVTNGATNTTGGTYGATFQNSMLAGGVSFLNAGDSNALRNVFFPPDITDANASNQGVYANLIAGAGVLLMDNVNCQALNGCLAVDNAASVVVKNPNFEQVGVNAENNTSMIDLGDSIVNPTTALGPVIIMGGNIVSSDCTNHPFLISWGKISGGYFDGLRLGENCASYPHAMMQMLATSNNIGIGAGNTWFANGSVTNTIANQYTNAGTNNGFIAPGTTTNDNALTGYVGEYVSSSVPVGSAVSLTNTVSKDVTTISLTPGDWDVCGNVWLNPAGTTTISAMYAWINTAANTLPTLPNGGAISGSTAAFTTGTAQGMQTGCERLSLGTTTTVSLGTQVAFGTSTMSAYGFIGARRRR